MRHRLKELNGVAYCYTVLVLHETPIHFTIDEETTEGYTVFVELTATNSTTPENMGGVRLIKTDVDDDSKKLEGAVLGRSIRAPYARL